MTAKALTFLYHEVTDDPDSTGFVRSSALPYKHGIDEFKANLKALQQAELPVKSFEHITNKENENRYNLISFDDGGESNFHAASLLEEYGFKGMFFIVADYIGKKGFLNEDQILQLRKQGHLIGSHSKTHPNVFNALTYDELIREWSLSKQKLENLLHEPVLTCSIPGGFDGPQVYKAARACGYQTIFNSEPTNKIKTEYGLSIYGRVCPKKGTPIDKIRQLAAHKGLKQEQLIRQTKKNIKRLISPVYNRILQSRRHEE